MSSNNRKVATRIMSVTLPHDTLTQQMLLRVLEMNPAAIINAARSFKTKTFDDILDEFSSRIPFKERLVLACLRLGIHKIGAIKAYRFEFNVSLKEAKESVEEVAEKRNMQFGTLSALDHDLIVREAKRL